MTRGWNVVAAIAVGLVALNLGLRALRSVTGGSPGGRESSSYATKSDGVAFVLDAVVTAFPASHVHVYAVDGRFLSAVDARREPLAVAASNWAATASIVAIEHPNAILVRLLHLGQACNPRFQRSH